MKHKGKKIKMKTEEIKRLAQLLFDNAEMIVAELEKTSEYRSLAISLDMFKCKGEEEVLKLGLYIYSADTTHHHLYDDAICPQKLEKLWEQLNEEAGLNPLPEPVKVRKTLTN